MIKACGFCTKEFKGNLRKDYCSRACKNYMAMYKQILNYKLVEIKKNCDYCGKEFLADNEKNRFCSNNCKKAKRAEGPSKSLLQDVYIRCVICGEIISLYGNAFRKTCSSKCAIKWKHIKEKERGYLPPCKKKRIKPVELLIDKAIKSWLNKPFKIKYYQKCQECGKWFMNKYHKKYCSYTCEQAEDKRNGYKQFRKKKCITCGKIYLGLGRRGCYCSRKCKTKEIICTDCGVSFKITSNHVAKITKCQSCRKAKVGYLKRRAALIGSNPIYKKALKEYKSKHKYFICHYCESIKPIKNMSIDHIVPISKGGIDEPSNWVYACHTCNSHKTDMSYIKYINKINNKDGQLKLAI